MNENIDESIINRETITSKYIIDCLENPMLTVAATSVSAINNELFVSVLNTCETYQALKNYRDFILDQIDRVSEISGISKSVLREFLNKLGNVISWQEIRPTDFLQCKTFDINAVGYGDSDHNGVNINSENNLFKMFWDEIEFDKNEEQYQFCNLPFNGNLQVLLNKDVLLVNIAKNTRTFLTQCNETVTENDIDFLNLNLLDEFISVENKTFTLFL